MLSSPEPTGRTYDIGRALVLAGVLMILANPMLLAYDVSFQLSFLATVAVVFLSPKIEKYFLWVTPRFGLRDIVSVTVAAYLFVLPFILYEMGNLSLVALPANILVLPFVPVTMVPRLHHRLRGNRLAGARSAVRIHFLRLSQIRARRHRHLVSNPIRRALHKAFPVVGHAPHIRMFVLFHVRQERQALL
ncbi:MAG: ComEC/Rec2 family competence protein [bacterium]